MKTNLIKLLSIYLLILLASFFSCKEDPVSNPDTTADFYATYSNPKGIPSLNITTGSIPDIIKITTSPIQSTSCSPSRLCIDMRNVRFIENNQAYKLKKLDTYELNSGEYIIDVENYLRTSNSRTLDFVLVLDISSSLGADKSKVIQSATDLITKISTSSSTTRVGVVIFSGSIEVFPLSSDFAAAKSFTNGKNGTDATKLFEAIDSGINMLSASKADGMAMIIFTDGINNSWTDAQKFQTNNYVINKIKQPINGTFISSFTIGLSGSTPSGALTTQLQQLALNGGISEVAENSDALQNTFTKFANSVSEVYTLTYDRNPSQTAIPIQLKYTVTLTPLK